MPSRLFSDVELERLRTFPEISSEELIRYFTLTAEDVQFVDRRRRNENRLGIAVQLCALPWLGFVPDDVGGVPVKALERLAQTLDTPVTDLGPYGRRESTTRSS